MPWSINGKKYTPFETALMKTVKGVGLSKDDRETLEAFVQERLGIWEDIDYEKLMRELLRMKVGENAYTNLVTVIWAEKDRDWNQVYRLYAEAALRGFLKPEPLLQRYDPDGYDWVKRALDGESLKEICPDTEEEGFGGLVSDDWDDDPAEAPVRYSDDYGDGNAEETAPVRNNYRVKPYAEFIAHSEPGSDTRVPPETVVD